MMTNGREELGGCEATWRESVRENLGEKALEWHVGEREVRRGSRGASHSIEEVCSTLRASCITLGPKLKEEAR
jgi:hypothetical protein